MKRTWQRLEKFKFLLLDEMTCQPIKQQRFILIEKNKKMKPSTWLIVSLVSFSFCTVLALNLKAGQARMKLSRTVAVRGHFHHGRSRSLKNELTSNEKFNGYWRAVSCFSQLGFLAIVMHLLSLMYLRKDRNWVKDTMLEESQSKSNLSRFQSI